MDAQSSPAYRLRAVFDWLDHVCADKRLSDAAFRVAYSICQHMNRGTGSAWPSLPRLAEQAAVSISTVQLAVKQLARCGFIAVQPGKRGRGHSNTYRLKLPDFGSFSQAEEAGKLPIDDPKTTDLDQIKLPNFGNEPTYRTNLRTNEHIPLTSFAATHECVSPDENANVAVTSAIKLFGKKDARDILLKLVDVVGDETTMQVIAKSAAMSNRRRYIDAVIAGQPNPENFGLPLLMASSSG
jgi:DNA-binding transcriptional regulator YhcF (GntR family)